MLGMDIEFNFRKKKKKRIQLQICFLIEAVVATEGQAFWPNPTQGLINNTVCASYLDMSEYFL